ncbi:MAG: NADH-quinone oxidoreductase subunit I, partial [Gammaproteobacteria bacterium]|nr:NADH-quinone oxidoreductase subunit I [Gammaproteobacteria bacterium]
MLSQLRTLWTVFKHTFMRNETVQYPEEMPYQA